MIAVIYSGNEIRCKMVSSEESSFELNCGKDESYLVLDTDENWQNSYINDLGEITLCKDFDDVIFYADSLNVATPAVITGIPANTVVTWPDGVITTETDSKVVCYAEFEGELVFTLSHSDYALKEVKIYVGTQS